MTINAIQLECKKDGLQQRQDGTWKLILTVNGDDMQAALGSLGKAAMGTRYMVALAQIGDDEQPAEPERPKAKPPMTESQRCGMLCADGVFQSWLSAAYRDLWKASIPPHGSSSPDIVASHVVRNVLGIESRRDLDMPDKLTARNRWHAMLGQFEADTGRMAERTR